MRSHVKLLAVGVAALATAAITATAAYRVAPADRLHATPHRQWGRRFTAAPIGTTAAFLALAHEPPGRSRVSSPGLASPA
jgi:hypothetical protein